MKNTQLIDLPFDSAEVHQWYFHKLQNDPLQSRFKILLSQKICVMGGCGQVGSHLVTKLYELGMDAQQLEINDNLSLGQRENLPPVWHNRIDTRSHHEFVQDPPRSPDILIFVGGRSSAPHFNSLDDVLEEITTWKLILKWCVSQNIRLIFASTSSLCKSRPSLEDQKVWPGSLYELCKLMMEDMAIEQALSRGLNVQICRFFSVYGVTESHKGKYGNLYTQLLWHAVERTPFDIWGQRDRFQPGNQTRDIIFAPDVVRAILHLLTLPSPTPTLEDISALTYNIGQGQPLSVNQMIEHVSTILPNALSPIVEEQEVPATLENYVVHTWGDPRKLTSSGYQPLFPDNIENLKFISYALLTEMAWYWSLVEDVRKQSQNIAET